MKSIIFILGLVLVGSPVFAQVPQHLNYQGRVSVQDVNFNGTGQFKFALVDAGTNLNQTATATGIATVSITSISINSGGSGYTTAPLVTIPPPDDPEGVQATATATISGGVVTGIAITEAGSGYFNNPVQVTIEPPPQNIEYQTYWSNSGDLAPGEVPATAVAVPVTNGLYSVRLGDPALGMASFHADTFQSVPLFLRVWFSDGTHGFQQLTPDQPLAAAPYAFTSQLALTVPNGSIGSSQLASGAITSSKLAAGAAAANLDAAGQSGVASGGMILSYTENPGLVNAGYVPMGSFQVGNKWTQNSSGVSGRYGNTIIWTGDRMVVWGGRDNSGVLRSGGSFSPVANTWSALSLSLAPSSREEHTAVWTGNEMIVWGGMSNGGGYFNDGGRYSTVSDTWLPTGTVNVATKRRSHTAVWTGTEMIVWGGHAGNSPNQAFTNSGARYNPANDSWSPISTTNAPNPRAHHCAVWTGTEMLVWGGTNGIGYFDTGGRYNPTTDTWTTISQVNAPSSRYGFSTVWTGGEMIVWGGADLNTGGRYNPTTDTWLTTSTTLAPSGRNYHRSVWTGQDMIVWGGTQLVYYLNTGGRYNPATNTWLPTSMESAPPGRSDASVVWSGTEVLLFGGYTTNGVDSIYYNDTWSYAPGKTFHLYQRP